MMYFHCTLTICFLCSKNNREQLCNMRLKRNYTLNHAVHCFISLIIMKNMSAEDQLKLRIFSAS